MKEIFVAGLVTAMLLTLLGFFGNSKEFGRTEDYTNDGTLYTCNKGVE